ncbi:MAG: gliding motility-associated C-terminal domain-containing protein [Vicingaceae bacterium]
MSDKLDNIEGLFKDSFDHFEPDVDPSVWENIASQVGTQPVSPDASSAGSSVSAGTSASVAVKIAVVAATAGLLTIATYVALRDSDPGEKRSTAVEQVIEPGVAIEENEPTLQVLESAKESEMKSAFENVDGLETENNQNGMSTAPSTRLGSMNNIATATSGNVPPAQIEAPAVQPVPESVSPNQEKTKIATAAATNSEKRQPKDERILPEASIYASLKSGKLPLSVRFENHGSQTGMVRWIIAGEDIDRDVQQLSHTFTNSGNYWVVLEITDDKGYRSKDSVEISVDNNTYIKIPNAFSPNGDGINDAFVIDTDGLSSIKCSILDQTGKEVFRYEQLHGHWDGRDFSGRELPQGTYFFIVEAYDSEQNPILRRGTVSLFRNN